jgi:hypothetical protein
VIFKILEENFSNYFGGKTRNHYFDLECDILFDYFDYVATIKGERNVIYNVSITFFQLPSSPIFSSATVIRISTFFQLPSSPIFSSATVSSATVSSTTKSQLPH